MWERHSCWQNPSFPPRGPRWHLGMCLSGEYHSCGLQGGPAISGLGLLLAPESRGQDEKQDGKYRLQAGPSVKHGVLLGPTAPWSPGLDFYPKAPSTLQAAAWNWGLGATAVSVHALEALKLYSILLYFVTGMLLFFKTTTELGERGMQVKTQ